MKLFNRKNFQKLPEEMSIEEFVTLLACFYKYYPEMKMRPGLLDELLGYLLQ